MTLVRAFLRNDSGATAIEYGLIATFVALVIITSMRGIGTRLNTKFQTINGALS